MLWKSKFSPIFNLLKTCLPCFIVQMVAIGCNALGKRKFVIIWVQFMRHEFMLRMSRWVLWGLFGLWVDFFVDFLESLFVNFLLDLLDTFFSFLLSLLLFLLFPLLLFLLLLLLLFLFLLLDFLLPLTNFTIKSNVTILGS